jgi:hypothetical protein
MLNTDDAILTVFGDESVHLHHRHGRLPTPQLLDLGGNCTAGPAICRIDDFSDDMAVVDSQRVTSPTGTVTIQSTGRLPFGTAFLFAHTARYSPGLARITTDVTVPSRAEIKHLEIASLVLGDGWASRAEVTRDGLSEQRPIGDAAVVWDDRVPLAVILSDDNGTRLEIGSGSDLWRWRTGTGGAANRPIFELSRQNDGLAFRRLVTRLEADTPVEARVYRFTWYLARSLAQQLDEEPDGEIVIDLRQIPWDRQQLTPGSDRPCAAARGTIKRLKRVVRQVQAVSSESQTPVCFAGIHARECRTGSHVFRSGERLHWDLPAILDFGQWTRQQLGRERSLRVTDSTDLPSLNAMFNCVYEDEVYEPYDES